MRTLYVSDLDGTLFNSQKQVTNTTAAVINKCISKGALFTVATARMPYGCDYKLEEINLTVPAVLTNGVFLYNFSDSNFESVEIIDDNAVAQALEAFRKHRLSYFLYTFQDNRISMYFDNPAVTEQTQYFSVRARDSCREIVMVDDCLAKAAESRVIYVAVTGEENELLPVKRELDAIGKVNTAFYLNIYNGLYCLEVFSETASKKNALKKLEDLLEYDELVVFGDNLNDLSMIEIADRSYAPENALDVVKNSVTAILDDCDNDGVAKQLAKEFGISLGYTEAR